MEYLHIASKKNIKSILTHGILPSYIKLDHHWEAFERYGLKQRKCVYTWDGETYNNTKFIKDMIYTKFYIHPRNDIYERIDHEVNFKKFGDKVFGDDETFFLLKINWIDDWIGEWQHVQEPSDEETSTTVIMDDKYAHNDKLIHISRSIIKPSDFEIVEQINTRVYKDNSMGFSFKKFG